MPRQNAPRPIAELRGEANLARRIEYERTARGWSYRTLADKMTEVGCPIDKSSLHRIEAGDPPRKITVNELVALSEVFGLEDIDDMLRPMEAVLSEEARALLGRMKSTQEVLIRTIDEMIACNVDYLSLGARARGGNEAAEFVLHQWEAFAATPAAHTDYVNAHARPTVEESADAEAARHLNDAVTAILSAAAQYADAVVKSRG